MAFKFVFFAALVAVARAGVLAPAPFAAPIAYQAGPAIAKIATPVLAPAVVAKTVVADADYDPNPQYSYAYDIQDAITGDSKNHIESRNGDVVQGSYSLLDADGLRRTVEYTADPINGFNAVVHREPEVKAVAPVIAKVAAPVAYAAPIAKVAHIAPAPIQYAAPLQYAAPIAKVAHIAPAPIQYAAPAPIHYAAPAPIHYAAPAPIHYAAPIAKVAHIAPAPIQYAAPLHYAAPIAKVAHVAPAPIAYAASPYGAAPIAKFIH